MEAFLSNVPKHMSDDGLRKELKPFMEALGIVDWTCDKPRGRDKAWVIFLKESEGKSFLKKHEKSAPRNAPADLDFRRRRGVEHHPRPRATARLHILTKPVYVEKSTRPADPELLNHLRYMKSERTTDVIDRDLKAPAINANMTYLSCGKNIFTAPSSILTFVEQTRLNCSGVAKFGRRYMTMTIKNDHRIDIPYNIIQDLIAEPSSSWLTLVLNEPPRIYSRNGNGGENSPYGSKWDRETSVKVWPTHSRYVAHCLVYQVCLTPDHFANTISLLKSRDLLAVTRQHLPIQQIPRPYEEDYTTCIKAFDGRLRSAGAKGKASPVPFPILFQVQALVSNNYLHPASALKLLEILEGISKNFKKSGEEPPFTADSMKQLFQRIPYPCPGVESRQLLPEELLMEVMEAEQDLRLTDPNRTKDYGAKIPDHQAWVQKVTVTPTRIVLSGPDAESKNRVLRLFPGYTDYFIRVTFADEDGQGLTFNTKINNEKVFERYKKVMRDGIQIAGRRFDFLGFSHSSLRAHSCWFSAAFIDDDLKRQDYSTIIASLGDFTQIRIPAKCAARIGQAFSETPYVVPIMASDIRIQWIPDVKSADGSRVFSDGVGTISREAMEEVWDHMSMKAAAPTAFQVRLAGVKGMLSLDTRLKGKTICLRKESMMKFDSQDYESMGICDAASKPLRMVLNRQIIKILEDMGTNPNWFKKQQNKALETLKAVTATPSNTSTFLEYQLVGTHVGFSKFIRGLNRMGIDYRRDRFMKSVVEHVVLSELRLLKHKARIPVDKGVTLFGVMDETGFLKEGEVYITYERDWDHIHGRTRNSLRDGGVIITRSPALHPGDVQYVTMVTPPDGHPLRHLRNCVVFSQHGERDLPSQLSGGDLDGDLYSIIWDDGAHPGLVYKAADYPRVVPEPLDRNVNRHDMQDFFLNFMETDILGLIANRHLIVADVRPRGTMDPDSIRLAEMHSTAVDFSKTGIPVSPTELPRAPRTRPDFLAPAPPLQLYDMGQISHIGENEENDDDEDGMGTAKFRYHKSEKILGELYRAVDEKRIWNEDVHRHIDMAGPSVWDQLLESSHALLYAEDYTPFIDYRRKIKTAWEIRNHYENSIENSMFQFSDNPRVPITEVEAFCGSILNKTGSQTRKQRDNSIKLKEDIDHIMNWIVGLIRDRGGRASHDEAELSNGADDEDTAEQERINAVELCWACVVVGCATDSKASKMYHGTARLESFRVVAGCCLVKELGELLTKKRARTAGGYLGVKSGQPRQMVLAMR